MKLQTAWMMTLLNFVNLSEIRSMPPDQRQQHTEEKSEGIETVTACDNRLMSAGSKRSLMDKTL